jgi:two-component system, sensor histidine kinase and response regulator
MGVDIAEGTMDRYHILLAEDDDILRRGVTELLEVSGYHVHAAPDGIAALCLLEDLNDPPDLIISDIAMPLMDGYQLLTTVRARPRWLSIPFIFLTAKAEKEDIRLGKLQGVDDYITKPFDLHDLLVAVQSTLNRYKQLNDLQEQEMDSLRQQILTILNHEFRTPLTYIVAYANLMSASPTFTHSDELKQYINGILQGSERLSRLVESLLLLAELESGNGQKIFERRKILISDIAGLLREGVAQFQDKAAERDLKLHMTSGAGLPPVMGDPEYLNVALGHLVENAIKFSPEEGNATISVTLETHDENIVIEISDKGTNIPPEKRKHLFEPFYQHARDDSEQQGVGAGLTIARHVAMLHGGRVDMASKPEQGNCLVFTLPIYQE